MTFEQVRTAALSRLMEFTDRFPSGVQVPYRRIGVRQQWLYALAARVNPDYATEAAEATLSADPVGVDLDLIADPIETPENLTRIEIKDAGTSSYSTGDKVTVVPVADQDGLAPRVTIRNRAIYAVGTDLDDVTSLLIYYPYRPEPTDSDEDGTRTVEITQPYEELLVIDLAREYIRKSLSMEPDQRGAVVGMFDEEEAPLLEAWLEHVRTYAPTEGRFRTARYGGGAG